MKKRILSMLLVLVMVVGMLPMTAITAGAATATVCSVEAIGTGYELVDGAYAPVFSDLIGYDENGNEIAIDGMIEYTNFYTSKSFTNATTLTEVPVAGETYYGSLIVNLYEADVDWDMSEGDVDITIPGFDVEFVSFMEREMSSYLEIKYSATKTRGTVCAVEAIATGCEDVNGTYAPVFSDLKGYDANGEEIVFDGLIDYTDLYTDTIFTSENVLTEEPVAGETYYGALIVNLYEALVDWDMSETDVDITIPGFDVEFVSFMEREMSSYLEIKYSATKTRGTVCSVEAIGTGYDFVYGECTPVFSDLKGYDANGEEIVFDGLIDYTDLYTDKTLTSENVLIEEPVVGETYYGALKVNLYEALVDWDMSETDVDITIKGFDVEFVSFMEREMGYYLEIKYSATKLKGHTVEFVVDDLVVCEQSVDTNRLARVPTPPEKAGYVFMGWVTEDNKLYDFSTPVTSDMRLVAKFGKDTIYFCSFESEADFDAWQFVDADGDGHNWISAFSSAGIYGCSTHGENALCSHSYHNKYGALTPDNYAYSPVISLPGNSNIVLRYTAFGVDMNYSYETYTVYVQTSDNELHEVHHETLPNGHNYSNPNYRSIDLSEFAGQDVRIVFRHHDSTDVYNIGIDEVLIVAEENGMLGDVNGDDKVTSIDATVLRRHLTEWDAEIVEANCDVDGNGTINNIDATIIRRYLAGFETVLG